MRNIAVDCRVSCDNFKSISRALCDFVHHAPSNTSENIMKKAIAVLLSFTIVLSGCAGREANPVAITQPNDGQLSCKELTLQIGINNKSISSLMGEKQRKSNNNAVAVGVGAIVFFPALFFMNLKGADKAEALAYQRRNQGLLARYKAKNCRPILQETVKSTD